MAESANGEPLVIDGALLRAVVKAGTNSALAGDFVRFLAEEGWLAHWLDFAGDEILPPMRKVVEQPFWLDPSDPHRMRSAMQLLSQPRSYDYVAASGDWWHAESLPWSEEGGGDPWPEAVHRVAVEGSPQSRRSTRRSPGLSRC
jgi:multiple sugar transport system substrate-binding protein